LPTLKACFKNRFALSEDRTFSFTAAMSQAAQKVERSWKNGDVDRGDVAPLAINRISQLAGMLIWNCVSAMSRQNLILDHQPWTART
jgi:hypothetical protein